MNRQIINKLEEDYGFAVIHSLWCEYEKTAYMIFCMIEMCPSEIEDVATLLVEKESDSGKLYFCIEKKTVVEAVLWYKGIMDDRSVFVNGNKIIFNVMKESLPWPLFELADSFHESYNLPENVHCYKAPFVSDSWGIVRTHYLTPEICPVKLKKYLEDAALSNWIAKCLTWDINSWPDLLGSVCLVLPNPFYTYRSIRLLPDFPNESVMVSFLSRKGRNLDTLNVKYCGEDASGSFHDSCKIKENHCVISLNGKVRLFGISVETAEGQVLDCSAQAPFIREIKVSIN